MFLAGDRVERREQRVRGYLSSDPGVSLLLAAVNFEWTVSRAVIFLSASPTTPLRKKMSQYYSPDAYKVLWKAEVCPAGPHPGWWGGEVVVCGYGGCLWAAYDGRLEYDIIITIVPVLTMG